MDDKNKGRLIKLLNMLGSQYEGEVLAAAHAIAELLKRENTTWDKLLASVPPPPEPLKPSPADRYAEKADWLRMMRDIINNPFTRPSTVNFVDGLCNYFFTHGTLTPAQRDALIYTYNSMRRTHV